MALNDLGQKIIYHYQCGDAARNWRLPAVKRSLVNSDVEIVETWLFAFTIVTKRCGGCFTIVGGSVQVFVDERPRIGQEVGEIPDHISQAPFFAGYT